MDWRARDGVGERCKKYETREEVEIEHGFLWSTGSVRHDERTKYIWFLTCCIAEIFNNYSRRDIYQVPALSVRQLLYGR